MLTTALEQFPGMAKKLLTPTPQELEKIADMFVDAFEVNEFAGLFDVGNFLIDLPYHPLIKTQIGAKLEALASFHEDLLSFKGYLVDQRFNELVRPRVLAVLKGEAEPSADWLTSLDPNKGLICDCGNCQCGEIDLDRAEALAEASKIWRGLEPYARRHILSILYQKRMIDSGTMEAHLLMAQDELGITLDQIDAIVTAFSVFNSKFEETHQLEALDKKEFGEIAFVSITDLYLCGGLGVDPVDQGIRFDAKLDAEVTYLNEVDRDFDDLFHVFWNSGRGVDKRAVRFRIEEWNDREDISPNLERMMGRFELLESCGTGLQALHEEIGELSFSDAFKPVAKAVIMGVFTPKSPGEVIDRIRVAAAASDL